MFALFDHPINRFPYTFLSCRYGDQPGNGLAVPRDGQALAPCRAVK